jgi:short-subunit dehydrogenase
MELERIIVTGASRGIGEAIAYRLARSRRRLLLLARTERDLERVARRARQQGAEVQYRCVDLARPEQVELLLDEIERDFGPVDALVLNAGVAKARPFLETDLASMDYELRVNFAATLWPRVS